MDSLTRMQAFTQVVDAGGFSAAARRLGKSKALLSKYVKDLEDELGARLLNRTTRHLAMTEVGQAYYRDALEILQRIDELTSSVRDTHRDPRGLIRASAPRTFGDGELGEAIVAFLGAHPLISLDLKLEDRYVDLVEEGFDVAIRIGLLTDSSLIAKRLADFRIVTVAAPEVIAAHGTPDHPRGLAELPCVIDTNSRGRQNWLFEEKGERLTVQVKSRFEVNSPAVVRLAALDGLGFARTPYFVVRDDLAAGRLVSVLDDFEITGLGIFAVYPHRRHLSGKVRTFVDHLAGWFEERRRAGASC